MTNKIPGKVKSTNKSNLKFLKVCHEFMQFFYVLETFIIWW